MAAEQIELHKSNFQDGTVGFDLFPDILEGRVRAVTTFTRPLPARFAIAIAFQHMRVNCIIDLLEMPNELFSTLTRKQQAIIERSLSSDLKGRVAIGPEGYLTAAIFMVKDPQPIPAKYEPERQRFLWIALNSLEDMEKEVLDRRFGLSDGLPKTQPQVGRDLDITEQLIRRTKERALSKLRHPSKSTNLSLFVPLAENSLGRALWEINLGFELNELLSPLDISQLKVSDLNLPSDWKDRGSSLFYWRDYNDLGLPRLLHWKRYEVPRQIGLQLTQALETLAHQRSLS